MKIFLSSLASSLLTSLSLSPHAFLFCSFVILETLLYCAYSLFLHAPVHLCVGVRGEHKRRKGSERKKGGECNEEMQTERDRVNSLAATTKYIQCE
jgi:hypothetical protein